MELKVLGSSSTGNGYLLTNGKETLILECGVRFSEVKKSLDFNLESIVGAVISHGHGDHSEYVLDYLKAGIKVLSNSDTFNTKGIIHHLAKPVQPLKGYLLGNFKVIPFELKHDVTCYGYIIDHIEMGRLVFITDTFYSAYKFPEVRHWLIEANYSDDILNSRDCAYKNRVYTSHMSIDNTKALLKANDLSKTNTIILCHLSDGNSNEKQFINEIMYEFGVITIAADKNVQINLNSL